MGTCERESAPFSDTRARGGAVNWTWHATESGTAQHLETHDPSKGRPIEHEYPSTVRDQMPCSLG
jgi:hypothetical protein